MVKTVSESEGSVPSYLTLAAGSDVVGTIEVKRSKFMAVLRRVDDEESARALVAELRRAHRDARHHCSAFVLGTRGETTRTNDDGEPSGTGGAPMLDVLQGAELSDVAAVVVRWFGGTLLGAGGLARAYGDAVTAALESATLVRREQRVLSRVDLPHADAGRVEADLRGRGIEVLGTEYGAQATLLMATNALADAEIAVASATAGAGVVVDAGVRWVDLTRS
ncbi:IMPACT family protein [Gordonia hydrophobica]|uniref:YigZ family protein n=1 Tax=Gordonia hydrophobica TaxID=40516 RepID=A0ABZ2TY64_9ACTN|nr:YigZ family protein [Gordonia hydrophobica]MBM7366954.1 putative YigZ family protein [Gordonia hydrophobica]